MRDRGPADAEQTAMVAESESPEPARSPAATDTTSRFVEVPIVVLVPPSSVAKPMGIKIDTALSLFVTISVLAAGILYSLWKTRNDMPEPVP